MATAFRADQRHRIDTRRGRLGGVAHGGCLVQHRAAGLLQARQQRLRAVARRLNAAHPLLDHHIDIGLHLLILRRPGGDIEIHAEIPAAGHLAAAPHGIAEGIGIGVGARGDEAHRAGIHHGGDIFRRRQPHQPAAQDRLVDAEQLGQAGRQLGGGRGGHGRFLRFILRLSKGGPGQVVNCGC